jgi:uncharacterized Tic20 family protein
MKRCLQCNALMPEDEVRCISCSAVENKKPQALDIQSTVIDERVVNAPKKCPKCSHINLTEAKAPQEQCPSCGIVYHKYAERNNTTNSPDRSAVNESDDALGLAGKPCYTGLIASLSLFTGFALLTCGIIWFACRKTDELAVGYAQEGINHQITFILGALIGAALIGALLAVSRGLGMLAGIVAISWIILMLVTPIIASVKAFKGLAYRYPLVIHFIGNVYSD